MIKLTLRDLYTIEQALDDEYELRKNELKKLPSWVSKAEARDAQAQTIRVLRKVQRLKNTHGVVVLPDSAHTVLDTVFDTVINQGGDLGDINWDEIAQTLTAIDGVPRHV